MMVVRVGLLGGFALTVDGEPAPRDGWGRRQAAALVKVLALSPGHRLHREQVADMLWPDAPIDRAIPRLHKAAFFARQAVPSSVVLRGEMVSLFPRDQVVVDVEEFENLARAALATSDDDALDHALGFYGVLLPDDQYEPWVERRADALRMRYLQLLYRARRWNDIVQLDPADEVAHLALAKQYGEKGNRQAALRQLDRLERALSDLGLALGTDAAQLRMQLMADGNAQSPSPHRSGRAREPRHRFEHRRVVKSAYTHCRPPVAPRNLPVASCNSGRSCC